MLKLSRIIVVVIICLVVGLFAYQKQSGPSTSLGYFLLATEDTANAVSFPGCGAEYLVQADSETSVDLQLALNELFAVTDPTLSALTNSEIVPVVNGTNIDLQGSLISAGTCDTPRITNQIIKTVQLYLPDENYTITLNGEESAFRCFGDESGFCE